MIIPQPLDHFLTSLNANVVVVLLDPSNSLLIRRLVVLLREATAHDKYIACAEVQILGFDDLFDFCECNLVALPSIVFDAFSLGIGDVIDENATADDATSFGPVWILPRFNNRLSRQRIEESTGEQEKTYDESRYHSCQ